jgi:hypothetical protein
LLKENNGLLFRVAIRAEAVRESLLVYHLLLCRPRQLGFADFTGKIIVEHLHRPAMVGCKKFIIGAQNRNFYGVK